MSPKERYSYGASPREIPRGLWTRPQDGGHPSPVELTSYQQVPGMPNMELQDIMFALLGFGLALVEFFSIPLFLPFK